MQVLIADQCQYGLKSRSDNGELLPALKPTRLMTNAAPMAELLQKRWNERTCPPALSERAMRGGGVLPDEVDQDLLGGNSSYQGLRA